MVEFVSELAGYLSVLGSVVFFGSFGVWTKTKAVRDAGVEPLVIQAYMSVAIFTTSWIVMLVEPFHFTPYGIASAALWVPANCLAITSIHYAGLAVGQGVWSGVTIVVSFVWGAAVFHDAVIHSVGLKILSVVVLISGILALTYSTSQDPPPTKGARRFVDEEDVGGVVPPEDIANVQQRDARDYSPLDGPADGGGGGGELLPEDLDDVDGDGKPRFFTRRTLIGLGCAVALGIMNGSMLVPMKYVPPKSSGVGFAVSFGIGVILVTPCILAPYYLIRRQWPQWHVRVAMLRGFGAGLFWNLGNVFSMVAALSPLGLTIGFPLTQCALLIAGLWGLIYFREITRRAKIIVFSVGSLVLLVGATMLSVVG